MIRYIWRRRTTAVGYFQVTIGVLAATDGIFSHQALKIIILCNGLLTAWIGHYNNRQIKRQQAPEQK